MRPRCHSCLGCWGWTSNADGALLLVACLRRHGTVTPAEAEACTLYERRTISQHDTRQTPAMGSTAATGKVNA